MLLYIDYAEYNFGDYEGILTKSLLQDPEHNAWNHAPFSYNNGNPPHNGEKPFDFLNRVNAGIHSLFQEVQNKKTNALLVTHAKTLTARLYLMRLSKTYGTKVSLENIKSLESMFSFYPDGTHISVPNGLVSIDFDKLVFEKVQVP